MMMRMRYVKMAVLLMWGLPLGEVPGSGCLGDSEGILGAGLRAEAQGDYKGALKIWETAVTELEVPSLAIAVEHIRLATEREMDGHYGQAYKMYRWGIGLLTREQVRANAGALEQELARLEPLAGPERQSRWKRLLREHDPELAVQIQVFWEERDPTPATRHNERVLEHWQRIAWARRHFTRVKRPPYGTDARGVAWVQYGKPDRSFTEEMKVSLSHLEMIAYGLLRVPGRDPLPPPPHAVRTLAAPAFDAIKDTRVEIWIWNQPAQAMTRNLILMFGLKARGGFDRLDTVEDLIPPSLFTLTNRYSYQTVTGEENPPFNPGMILQFALYQQFSTKDEYFGDIYVKLDNAWNCMDCPGTRAKHAGKFFQQQHVAEFLIQRQLTPPELSTEERLFPPLPMKVYQYRLLDEEGGPVLATFVQSFPTGTLLGDLSVNQDTLLGEAPDGQSVAEGLGWYRLRHGVQLRQPDGKLAGQDQQEVLLVIDAEGQAPSESVFFVPHLQDIRQQFWAQLDNTHAGTRRGHPSLIEGEVRGLGKLLAEAPKRRLGEEPGLEVSDVVIGYGLDREPGEGVYFPFVAAHEGEVPEGENLVVYFEAYGLQQDEGGRSQMQVSYRLVRKGGFPGLGRKGSDVEVVLNFDVEGSRYKDAIEAELAGVDPGRYELEWTVRDKRTGAERSRKVDIRVN